MPTTALPDISGQSVVPPIEPCLPPEEDDLREQWLAQQVALLASRNFSEHCTGIDALPSVIAFMQHYFAESLTTDMLAHIAHVGKRQLFKLFRQSLAQSPNEYLLELRMNHAAKLLNDPSETVSSIARQVGFEDPFFFSRRFKQALGVAPRVYMHTKQTTPRVLLEHYTGFMLALDARPVGASLDYIKRDRKLLPHLHGIIDIGQPLQFERMQQLAPDLIVSYNTTHYSDLRAIADTTIIPWDERSFEQRMLTMGGLLGRRAIAAARLEQFHKSCAITRTELAHHIDALATWSLICITGDKIMLYTKHNMLYTMLGLQAPHHVQHLLHTDDSPDLFKLQITPEQLPLYNMNVLLLAVSQDPWSRNTFNQLLAHPAWQQLDAVRHHKVILVDEDIWVPSDPFTAKAQLTDLLRIAPILA